MSSFKSSKEAVWGSSIVSCSHTSAHQVKHRSTETVRLQILDACMDSEQSTSAIMRILKARSFGWVRKHVVALERRGYLSTRVVHNGEVKAKKFSTTMRGRQLSQHLRAFERGPDHTPSTK